MTISDNIIQVRQQISLAAQRSGRDPAGITLLAASKMNDASRIREAFAAGITVFGENRVQEMLEKNALGAYDGAHLHFIGHLQKNKARQIVGIAELIHSVDSTALLALIAQLAQKKGIVQDVLLEVNIGGEASKSGFSPEEVPSALDFCEELSGVHVRGLMAIPPVCSDLQEIRPYFAQMQQLFVDIGGKKYDNSTMDFLSMGMSHDFSVAVEYGSNIIRIGSGIFGPRQYNLSADHTQQAQ